MKPENNRWAIQDKAREKQTATEAKKTVPDTQREDTFVRIRRNPERTGVLTNEEKNVAGTLMVRVRFGNGQLKWIPHSALEPVPATGESLQDRFSGGRFVSPNWLRRTLTRLRVTGRLQEVVYSMEATETDFYAYQFKPVLKLMNSPTDALLIADEVGLGKTIEAGLVWTELRARLDCDRLLVVCPKTLCQKWQDELARRFGVDARIGDARTLLNTMKTARQVGGGYAMVCSMQGLRPPRGWDDPGEDGGRTSPRRNLALFLNEAGDGEPLIDLLVIDEAHHMRNPDTLLHRFGRLANAVASHRLFLSATPIHLRNRDLHSLLTLVDPYTFEFQDTLNELIKTNEPIIAARDMLLSGDGSPSDVLQLIAEAQDHDILRGSRALAQIRREIMGTTRLDRSRRSELAARMERVNQLANYVTRTRRRDVGEFGVIRDPVAPILEMSDDERAFYTEICDLVKNYAWDRDANELFLLSTPQRLLTSSLAAASKYWSRWMTEAEAEIEESDRDLEETKFDQRPLVGRIAQHARSLDMTTRLIECDTKYRLLLRELRKLWRTEHDAKIIVFSSFIPTLTYLQERLRADGIESELMHGQVGRPRGSILERFRSSASVRILLSSEVGSEGVDLQFSATIVNYDLPWNPMRLEQRIGRVDRLGQKKDKVMILNLIYDDTIDKRIYERLYERLQIGRRALGEMEVVLGKPIRELEKTLLDPRLSDEQKERAIDRTAQALVNRRRDEKQLEEEAGSLVQHGDYILTRIAESRSRNRWISGEDILTYVRDCVIRDFPGSFIESSPKGTDTYRIRLSSKGLIAFREFVARRGVKGKTRLFYDDDEQRYRFTSSVVQAVGRIEDISQVHPLVRFAVHRDLTDNAVCNAEAVATCVDEALMPCECTPGVFVLAARHWSVESEGTRLMTTGRIGYAGADVQTGTLIASDIVERMMACAAQHGRPLLNAAMHDGLDAASNVMTEVVDRELDRSFEEFCEQAKAETEDRVEMRRRSLDRHFQEKIDWLSGHQRRLKEQAELAICFGDLRRARNLTNLAAAQGVRRKRLRRTWQLRQSDLESQRSADPEEAEVVCVFLQVDA